jgi:hypothetical protein
MTRHKCKVGQNVRFMSALVGAQNCKIMRLLRVEDGAYLNSVRSHPPCKLANVQAVQGYLPGVSNNRHLSRFVSRHASVLILRHPRQLPEW